MDDEVMDIGLDIDRLDSTLADAKILAHEAVVSAVRRRSANGKLHYRVQLRAPISIEASFLLRETLDDDPTRIRADRVRHTLGQDIDVLYMRKGHKYAGAWEPVQNAPNSMPPCA